MRRKIIQDQEKNKGPDLGSRWQRLYLHLPESSFEIMRTLTAFCKRADIIATPVAVRFNLMNNSYDAE
jgi:hypothetical protein